MTMTKDLGEPWGCEPYRWTDRNGETITEVGLQESELGVYIERACAYSSAMHRIEDPEAFVAAAVRLARAELAREASARNPALDPDVEIVLAAEVKP